MAMHRKIEWDESAGAAGNARLLLPALLEDYFARGRKFLAKDLDPAEFHRIRLETKRLRYTLELFRPCYGPGLEARLSALRRNQQVLGDLNDAVATGKLLTEWMVKPSPQRARIAKFLEARAAQGAADFRKHWAEVFDAPGQEQWWCSYLEHAPARSAAGESH